MFNAALASPVLANVLATMMSVLSFVAGGVSAGGNDVVQLLWYFIGAVILVCIALFIMQKLGAPKEAYWVLWAILGICAFILVAKIFFGGGPG